MKQPDTAVKPYNSGRQIRTGADVLHSYTTRQRLFPLSLPGTKGLKPVLCLNQHSTYALGNACKRTLANSQQDNRDLCLVKPLNKRGRFNFEYHT